ncbi:type VI secretion system-associated protein TagF [Rhizobacter sp. J219]|uniref:type VI secretion system-associated protein TagF n=1 Tax=Rhizobacter sp. J219 TaxID=2898430 RepID=UPI00215141B7|nr:type VI secretion system-associated protein TagF [Rhizobacter sp. J219]MCR5883319.1 type VI secretion system-associated protein TagF [Rhizobacter sp. J219]
MSAAAQALYFGKLPSRGDFVRSSAGSALIHSIDQWMSQTLELLAEDTRWKIVYDAASPVHFAILGTQSNAGLVGHMVASQDASGRRFPFVLAASFEVGEPLQFLPYSPQALSPLWGRLDSQVRVAQQASDFTEVQDQLLGPLEVEMQTTALRESYKAFAQQLTIERLEASLTAAGAAPVSFRQTALALGLLLQPVLSQGHADLNKGLLLPLPRDPMQLPHVLTMWVDLISRFFARTSAETAIFVTMHGPQPVLVMGFHGASPLTLRSVLDSDASRNDNVTVTDAEWVEDWIGSDYGLRKLSNHLRDPSLSLAAAVDLFRETFLGE